MNSSINAFSCLVQALPFRRLSNGFKCSVYRFTLVQSKLELYLLWLQENIFFFFNLKNTARDSYEDGKETGNYTVTWTSSMAERSSGESITAFRWFTIPQTTDNLSLIFSNGSTNFGHVGSPLVSNSTKLLSYTYHRIITSRKIFNSCSELQ